MTKEELYRYQFQTSIPLSEIHQSALAVPGIKYQNGFYGFASEFQELWTLRQIKDRESLRRYRKIQRYGKLLISCPFVRGVFVAGSLTFASGNANQNSDIDVFVVSADQKIWIARLFITMITQIFGIRRRGDYDENLFCLNHYVTESNLYRDDQDMYSALLYSDYLAIGRESQQTLSKFWEVNAWRKKFFPQAITREHINLVSIKTCFFKKTLEQFMQRTGLAWLLNRFSQSIQESKIKSNQLTQVAGARIKATDQELEFHPYPNTYKVQKAFQAKLRSL
jgi:predicted nucleotidyltransferase